MAMRVSEATAALPEEDRAILRRFGENQFPKIDRPTVSFLGGIDEIGAINVLIADGGENPHTGKKPSIFLDHGLNMEQAAKTSGTGFSSNPYGRGIKVLMEEGIVHPIPGGHYRGELEKHQNLLTLFKALERSEKMTEPELDKIIQGALLMATMETKAILNTHAHLDHTGLIPYVNLAIPVFMSEITFAILHAIDLHSSRWDSEVTVVKLRHEDKIGRAFPHANRNIHLVEEYKKYEYNGFTFTFITVDHSLLGACGIHVQLPGGETIFYTGDIRMGEKTERMIEWLNRNPPPDFLIIDGTNVNSKKEEMTEDDVRHTLEMEFKDNNTFFVRVPTRHFQRIFDVIESARKNGKKVYLPMSVAYYIYRMHQYKQMREKLPREIFERHRKAAKKNENLDEMDDPYTDDGKVERYERLAQEVIDDYLAMNPTQTLDEVFKQIPDLDSFTVYLEPKRSREYVIGDYATDHRDIFESSKVECVNAKDMGFLSNQPSVVLFDMTEQLQMFRSLDSRCVPSNARLIHSSSGWYGATGQINKNKDLLIYKQLGLFKNMKFVHASGHCSEDDIRYILKRVLNRKGGKATTVVPLHTNYPLRMAAIVESVAPGAKVIGKDGRIYQYWPYDFDGNVIVPRKHGHNRRN